MIVQIFMNHVRPPKAYLFRAMKLKIKHARPGLPMLIGSSTMRRIQTDSCVDNVAVDGSGTLQLKLLREYIADQNPAYVVCYSGVNDLLHMAPSDIVSNIVELSTELRCPFIYISIICSTIQHFIGLDRITRIENINKELETKMAGRQRHFLDVSKNFKEHHFEDDGLHLNTQGGALLVAFLKEFLIAHNL